jgi:hypothetical protein
VVALHEVGDRRERRRHERRRAPEPGETTAESGADVVDRERRDRPEHGDLEHRRQRQELHVARARDPGERREQHRPAVARERVADLSVAEQPARGDQPDLVATLVRQPAVVVDREEEGDRRADLDYEDCGERDDDVTGHGVRGTAE